MTGKNPQIVKINQKGWYVETRTGFEGPFNSEQEAATFLNLLRTSDTARMEFAGLQFTPATE